MVTNSTKAESLFTNTRTGSILSRICAVYQCSAINRDNVDYNVRYDVSQVVDYLFIETKQCNALIKVFNATFCIVDGTKRVPLIYFLPCMTVPEYLHTQRCYILGVAMMQSSNGNIFPITGPFERNSPVPVNSPHKRQWRGSLMFSLIFARTNGWVDKSRRRRFETPSRPLWRHYNVTDSFVRQES